MLKSIFFCGLGALSLGLVSTANAAICDSYIVTPGDTLRIIAERYYGARHLSSEIYDVNQEIIGIDPNIVEIGMNLAIPCRDGMTAVQQTAFLATVDQPETSRAHSSGSYFVAIAGATPFMNAQGSGIFPELLAVALRTGGFEERLEIIRATSTMGVLTETSQQSTLLSFPWIKPDCADLSRLSENAQNLCQNYIFSDPIYEITLGLFTRAGDPLEWAVVSDDFSGKDVCIPGFHTDELLRKNAILGVDVNIFRAGDFMACLAGLADERYDLIVGDYQSYSLYAAEDSSVADIPAFASKTTLHAVASVQNQKAVALIAIANAGLKQMLASGAWFNIVKAYTARQFR